MIITPNQAFFLLDIINGGLAPFPPPIRETRVIRADTQESRVISIDTQEERIT